MKLRSCHHCKKMKFSIMDFLRKRWILSHLLKKSLMENFIFCAVHFHSMLLDKAGAPSPLSLNCFDITRYNKRLSASLSLENKLSS